MALRPLFFSISEWPLKTGFTVFIQGASIWHHQEHAKEHRQQSVTVPTNKVTETITIKRVANNPAYSGYHQLK